MENLDEIVNGTVRESVLLGRIGNSLRRGIQAITKYGKETACISLASIALGFGSNSNAKNIYVDDSATGLNDGTSWVDAYNYLQDALALALVFPQIRDIHVAQGTYTPDQGSGNTLGDRSATFKLIDGVTLKGGFAGFGEPDPNAWDVDLYETALSGDLLGNDIEVENPEDLLRFEPTRAENSFHVVKSRDNPTAVLDGFTIVGGNANGSYGGYGAAGLDNGLLSSSSSSITVLNCTFTRNSAFGPGGGMYSGKSNPTLVNCTFSGNWAAKGGGMYSSGSPTLVNCTFSGNCAIYHGSGSRAGGGMYNSSGNATLTNCTFSRNWALGHGGAMYGSPTLVNCILWGNSPEGNFGADPLFADPDGPDNIPGTEDDDLRLSPISPCVDAGDPNYVPGPNETDCAGNPRIVSGRIDMGAYEFQGQIYVDDDASADPGPGDILVSDPLENGSEPHPMDSIQQAIDVAKDGYTVLVQGGVYGEPIDFKGKAITVTSGSDAAVLEAPGDYAVSFYSAEGPDSILKNFVIRNSLTGIYVSDSSPTIRNLTVVDNEYGITAYTWAEPDISNCIFWNNSEADLFQCEVRYSFIEDGGQGQGNIIIADPLFVDAENGDYHLKSKGWCWSTNTKSWAYDYVTSRFIDAGDPACPLGDEPMSVPRDPNNEYGINLHINMGAYGGTCQASIPPYDWFTEYETDPPEPDPARWAPGSEPREIYRGEAYEGGGSFTYWVQMTAFEATDASGGPVEYFFECTTESGFSSEWQSSRDYDFIVGRSGQGHRFHVKARDQFGNETAWSEELTTILITD